MDEKVIKAGAAVEPPAGGRILKREVFDAGVDARGIIEAARAQADALLRDAEATRNGIVEAAREEGYREGMAQWAHALDELSEAQATLNAKYEPEIVRMAVKIAEKIIGAELRTRPETIVSIARECLRGVRHAHNIVLRVNAAHVDEVQRSLSSLAETLGPSRRIQVQADSSVEVGGCVVESVVGVIDAKLETQLRCLEEVLLRVAVRR